MALTDIFGSLFSNSQASRAQQEAGLGGFMPPYVHAPQSPNLFMLSFLDAASNRMMTMGLKPADCTYCRSAFKSDAANCTQCGAPKEAK